MRWCCDVGTLPHQLCATICSEKDAAYMCRSILKVVGHCHSLGVIHRSVVAVLLYEATGSLSCTAPSMHAARTSNIC